MLYVAEVFADHGPDLKKVQATRPRQSFQDSQENKPYNHYIGSGEIRR